MFIFEGGGVSSLDYSIFVHGTLIGDFEDNLEVIFGIPLLMLNQNPDECFPKQADGNLCCAVILLLFKKLNKNNRTNYQ